MLNEDFIEDLKIILTILIILAIVFIPSYYLASIDTPKVIEYYPNDIKIDAIEYKNEIYLKKGE